MSEMIGRVELVLHDFLQGEMTIPEAARAAIEAMREPTEAMKQAYWDLIPDNQDGPHPAVAFRAMIDAALVSERGAEE